MKSNFGEELEVIVQRTCPSGDSNDEARTILVTIQTGKYDGPISHTLYAFSGLTHPGMEMYLGYEAGWMCGAPRTPRFAANPATVDSECWGTNTALERFGSYPSPEDQESSLV